MDWTSRSDSLASNTKHLLLTIYLFEETCCILTLERGGFSSCVKKVIEGFACVIRKVAMRNCKRDVSENQNTWALWNYSHTGAHWIRESANVQLGHRARAAAKKKKLWVNMDMSRCPSPSLPPLSASVCLHLTVSVSLSHLRCLFKEIKYQLYFCWGCPRGVMVKTMDNGIVVSKFVLQSRYYVHFRANTLGKGMNPLILPAMG